MLRQTSIRAYGIVLGCLVCFEAIKHLATFSLGPAPICMDAVEYFGFGRSVASGDLMLLTHDVSYRVPGYGWFLGAFLSVFDRYAVLATVITQHLLVMITSLIPAIICFRLTGRSSAFLAAYAIAVFCVSRAWFANVLLTDSVCTFCLALLWWAWYEYTRKPTMRASILLGAALSLATLIRPVPQLLWLPIVLTMILVAYSQSPKLRPSKVLAQCAVLTCVLAICLAPWCTRNQVLFGDAFLAKLPAVNKWLVCFQGGAGANLPLPNDEATQRLTAILTSCGHDLDDRYCYSVIGTLQRYGMSEREIDELVNKVCLTAIGEHPFRFGFSMFKRSVNVWRCLRNEHPAFGAGEQPNFGDQFTWRNETVATFYEPVLRNAFSRSLLLNELVMFLVALGSWWLVRDSRTRTFGVALVLAFLYFTAVTAAVEIENYRYRMILEPAMIVAVVGGAYTRFARSPLRSTLRSTPADEPLPAATL